MSIGKHTETRTDARDGSNTEQCHATTTEILELGYGGPIDNSTFGNIHVGLIQVQKAAVSVMAGQSKVTWNGMDPPKIQSEQMNKKLKPDTMKLLTYRLPVLQLAHVKMLARHGLTVGGELR